MWLLKPSRHRNPSCSALEPDVLMVVPQHYDSQVTHCTLMAGHTYQNLAVRRRQRHHLRVRITRRGKREMQRGQNRLYHPERGLLCRRRCKAPWPYHDQILAEAHVSSCGILRLSSRRKLTRWSFVAIQRRCEPPVAGSDRHLASFNASRLASEDDRDGHTTKGMASVFTGQRRCAADTRVGLQVMQQFPSSLDDDALIAV